MPVTSVNESQVVDPAGQLIDVYEITVTLADRPGAFTVTVPKAGDPVAAARAAIAELEGEVVGIYGLQPGARVPVAEPDWTPLPGRLFGDPPVDLAPLYVPTADHVVLSVYQTERYMSDGHPVPQIAVVFAVPGLPGTFTRRIANYRFEEGVALEFLQARAEQIRALYAL